MLAEKTSNCDEAIVNAAIADVGEIATLPEVTLKIIKIVENPKSTARVTGIHDRSLPMARAMELFP